MYLYEILRTNPFGAVGVCFCLVTAWLSTRAVKGRLGPDRFLLGVLGLLSIFQGLRILIDQSGGISNVFQRFQGIADATTSTLFLVAILILRASIAEHVNTRVTLRLVESEKRIPAPPPPVADQIQSASVEPQPGARNVGSFAVKDRRAARLETLEYSGGCESVKD